MGYSSNVYKAAADRLFERRLKAEKEADRRKAEIYKKQRQVDNERQSKKRFELNDELKKLKEQLAILEN